MRTYNQSEGSLPKWAQAELDELRVENINLREKANAALAAHIVKLDRDWFVMPGPAGDAPTIRLWTLGTEGPRMLGELTAGMSLAFQQVPPTEKSD